MLERYRRKVVLSSLFGCLACLAVASVVTADGRVFMLDLRNSSDGRGVGEAELACGEQRARLASAEELRHAVDECSFAVCTRGWLYGGTVGTTVCNTVGGALKAVGVRTDNVTEEVAHLDAFCIKDTDVPCGDPPSFPNTRLQGHSGFQMGDELLYTCLPGYLMPSGHTVFSLLCDSCGEWYGLVQLCVKDETETPVDYEDKFTDTYGEEEEEEEEPEEAQGGEVYEDVQEEPRAEEQQQEAVFHVAEGGEEHGEEEEEEEEDTEGVVTEGEAVEVEEVAGTVPAVATEQPVSLLSQKHLFWFPSEAFQEEGHAAPTQPPATPPATAPEGENRVRASGGQSEESKEFDGGRGGQYRRPAERDDGHASRERDDSEQDRDNNDSRPDDLDEHNDSHYDDPGVYGDGLHDDRAAGQDEHDDVSRHEDEDDDDRVKHHIVPSQREEEPPRRRYEDSDEHYDMGEHEDERRPHREGHDRDGGHDDDRDDAAEDRSEQVFHEQHPAGQEEDQDHLDSQEHHDHDHHDHDHHGDPDGHDDDNDDVDRHHHVVLPVDRHHVVLPMATAEPQTVTPNAGQTPATTDDTWLDGYAVITDEAEKGGSTQEEEEEEGPTAEDQEEGGVVVVAGGTTDSPNEVVEVSRPVPYTSLPDALAPTTLEPVAEQGRAEEVLPGLVPTAGPSETSEPPSYPDTGDYDAATYPVAPTRSWEDEPTEGRPFPGQGGPAPTAYYDPDVVTGPWGGSGGATGAEHNLTGLDGERGEVEGERGESGPPPPPPPSASGRGPAVAAVIVAVCAVAAAAAVGAWCYRRRQQKSSVYEMNGKNKGPSHSRHGQQIEMQQKV